MQKHNKLKEAIDLLASDGADLSSMLKDGGLLKQLSKALIERALGSEMDHHLGYQKYNRNESDNYRKGTAGKQLTTFYLLAIIAFFHIQSKFYKNHL